MPLVDEAVLSEYKNDIGEEKAKTLLAIVIDEIEMRSQNALKAFHESLLDDMRREFHTLKSICYMVGAMELGSLAKKIELDSETCSHGDLYKKIEEYKLLKEPTMETLKAKILEFC